MSVQDQVCPGPGGQAIGACEAERSVPPELFDRMRLYSHVRNVIEFVVQHRRGLGLPPLTEACLADLAAEAAFRPVERMFIAFATSSAVRVAPLRIPDAEMPGGPAWTHWSSV
ncbi:MAG: hypothetical protein M3P93_06390 [Actinomycetota bacterium]|nr:hypothetical protein [Actinomycetota bacterium]